MVCFFRCWRWTVQSRGYGWCWQNCLPAKCSAFRTPLFLDVWDLTIWVSLALASAALVDWLIIRRVWRAVNAGGGSIPPGLASNQSAINESEWNNLRNWTGPKWLSVYFSKRDLRAWVPKQIPALGWTVNLGNPRGAFALFAIVSAIFLLLTGLVGVTLKPAGPLVVHTGSIKSDYIGQTYFPQGDSIEITSVERSENHMTVKGHYNLVSADEASLWLNITATNNDEVPNKAL